MDWYAPALSYDAVGFCGVPNGAYPGLGHSCVPICIGGTGEYSS